MYFVEDYKNLVSDLSDRVKQYHNIDEFILDDVRDVNVLKDSEKLFNDYYDRMVTTDSETVYVITLERLNIGFRSLQCGLDYESTADLMGSSLNNDQLKRIIAHLPNEMRETIRSARTDEVLSDLSEVAAFVQEIDVLTGHANNNGLQM